MSQSATPSEVNVRLATEDDLPGVELVARQTWHATYAGAVTKVDIDRFLEANYSQEALKRRLAELGSGFAVAEVAVRVVGFSCLGRNRDGGFQVYAIYVLPDHQGHGVGSGLWRLVESEARRAGGEGFHLWVLSSNQRAIDFYAGKGGRVVGKRAFRIGESEIDETRFDFRLPD